MKEEKKSKVFREFLYKYKNYLTFFGVGMLLFCFPLSLFAQQANKKIISINLKEVSVLQALHEINRLSGNQVTFMEAVVKNEKKKITLSRKNVLVLEVVKACLEGTGLTCTQRENGKIFVSQQQVVKEKSRIVKGSVLDHNQEPLPGVTVVIKGTATGVATDVNGTFEIVVPAISTSTTVLVFSCIGMKNVEVEVKNDKPVNVTMEEAVNEVEEVVVNGIYTAAKNSYTGSASSVKSEDILAVSQTNVLKALSTLVPGLRIIENNEQGSNPNHIPEIIIRGATSISTEGEYGLNAPLIIVDGVETSLQMLYDMDIFEIDRVDVLKDASATAIYGDKAANGVIVVTRKRVEDSKLKARYNFIPNFGLPDVSSYNLCNAAEKLELERLWGKYEDPQGEKELTYNERLKRVTSGVNTDWKSIPLRNSWSQSHSVAVTGRGGGLDYSINAYYGDTHGVMKGDYRRNYGLSFYFSYNYKGKMTLTFNSDIRKTDSKDSPYGSFSDWVVLNPYDSPYDENGELIPLLSYDMANPMYNATTGSFSTSKSKSIGNNLTCRWNIAKNLIFNLSGNLSLNDSRGDTYLSSKHTSSLVSVQAKAKRGTYTVNGAEGTSWALQGSLSYSLPFDEQGTILTLNGGGKLDQRDSESFYFTAIGFLKPTMSDINFANAYDSGKPGGVNSYSASVALFGNMNFIFKNRYFVDASFRTSASSYLGSNNQWSPYWSLGFGWNVHNESFVKNGLSWITTLRLRASTGFVGSGNFSGNMAQTIYTYSENYITGLGAVPSQLGNPDLKAQRTLSMNGGCSLDILDGLLQVNMDFYRQKTKDALVPIGLPLSSGAETVQANLGETLNWGYELSVSARLVKTKDWQWRLTVNTHHTENKLLKISNALDQKNKENMQDKGIIPKVQYRENESMDAIYAVRSLGINPADGYEIFLTKDGVPTYTYNVEDMVALGDTKPWFEGSSTTSIVWKNISVGAAFSYTFGGYIYNSTRAAKVENIDVTKNVDRRAYTERWQKPGDVVAYRRAYTGSSSVKTERYVEKKNEVYLSSLSISYTVPQSLVRKIGLKRLSLGVTFGDVLRLSTVRYERGTSYPYMRSFNLRINPTF